MHYSVYNLRHTDPNTLVSVVSRTLALEERVSATQLKAVLSSHLYRMMKHFYSVGRSGHF